MTAADVRYWPTADILNCTAHVRFGSRQTLKRKCTIEKTQLFHCPAHHCAGLTASSNHHLQCLWPQRSRQQ